MIYARITDGATLYNAKLCLLLQPLISAVHRQHHIILQSHFPFP